MNLKEIAAAEIPNDYVHKGLEVLQSVDSLVQGHCQGMEKGIFHCVAKSLRIWATELEKKANEEWKAVMNAPVPVDMSAAMVGKAKLKG